MKIEIVHRYTAAVLYASETTESIAQAVMEAVSRGAYLDGANLRRANLEGANLRRANLRRANLEGASLEGANLRRANLEGASLEGANLRRPNLEGANLRRANLEGASLEGANLRRANLECATGLLSKPVAPLQILGTRDALVVSQDGYLTIGCEHHELVFWEKHYYAIGREHGYREEQAEEYRRHIAHARAWMEAYGVVDVVKVKEVV